MAEAAGGSRAELADLVARHEHAALAELATETAGTPLCRLDARAAHGAKYWEGVVAALAQIRRALRRADDDRTAAVLAEWAAQWGVKSPLPPAGAAPSWSAYREGGIAACAALHEGFTPSSSEAR